LQPLGLEPHEYAVIIARPEPENSILQKVRAFSRRERGIKLVVLGKYAPQGNAFQREVLSAASNEVIFPGPIYDPATVAALRYYCRLYLHGHTVGGTNPSLVEALGAGSPVLAHDNRFNRWVAGEGGRYFRNEDDCAAKLDALLDDRDALYELSEHARARFREDFTCPSIHGAYERLLTEHVMDRRSQ
jgi:glycosyltransferase involved in cell wall biosynthesis